MTLRVPIDGPAPVPPAPAVVWDFCAWCERRIKVRDRAWEGMASDEGLVAAGNYCEPVKGDPCDADWHDEEGVRHKGRVRSGCERQARVRTVAVVERLRRRQQEIAAAEAG